MTDHQPQSVLSSGQRIFARASAGFTLIEMLVVLTIISLIIGLVGPKVLGYLSESRVKTAKLQIESFNSALDLFYMDVGRYPEDSEGLKALVVRPAGVDIWNGPYVKDGRVPKDPWGHPYQYHTLSDHTPPYEITSLGPDGHGGKGAVSTDVANAAR
ncbi:type II secretion system major pseudopilin GspG [Methylovirgula sp. HY1]|uniref:type II secretion system major pseudopilin GspG n=1 Tax=Methylovirgula sp. HY1 TaxID=2822761 RepID=UPI001C5B9A33|nr:type II secretion system major pseudopilin GspG [Methylovirgula sp. HY1]QXX76271.1 Type II secretion system protein G [Methylovirgula sp. HY1]